MVRVNTIIPYTTEGNLGKEYNRMIRLIPDDEWVCIMDHDVLMLHPQTLSKIHEYADRNPGCLLTCRTNRINPSSPQLYEPLFHETNIMEHISFASETISKGYETTEVNTSISGFLMVFPKSLWRNYRFKENLKYLGVDTDFSLRVLHGGNRILIMDSIYVFHTYRMFNESINDKSHLL